MKNNSSIIGLLIGIGICLIAGFFYFYFLDKKEGYVIDNPSKQILNIKIDNELFTIAPEQQIRIKLNKGKHQLKYNLKEIEIDTLIKITKANGLINPVFSDYYIFTRSYGYRKNKDSIFNVAGSTLIDEKEYFGNIEHSNQIYIENFYYNLDEEYPGFFLKSEKKSDIPKIFSKINFKQFYFEHYE